MEMLEFFFFLSFFIFSFKSGVCQMNVFGPACSVLTSCSLDRLAVFFFFSCGFGLFVFILSSLCLMCQ
jgi:hypothetical protein